MSIRLDAPYFASLKSGVGDEDVMDLHEAIEEYTTGKTTSLDDAERFLEL